MNQSYPSIYEDYFKPWFKKVLPHLLDYMPCLGWMTAARKDKEFAECEKPSEAPPLPL